MRGFRPRIGCSCGRPVRLARVFRHSFLDDELSDGTRAVCTEDSYFDEAAFKYNNPGNDTFSAKRCACWSRLTH